MGSVAGDDVAVRWGREELHVAVGKEAARPVVALAFAGPRLAEAVPEYALPLVMRLSGVHNLLVFTLSKKWGLDK